MYKKKMAITERASYRDMMKYVESRLIPDIEGKKERGELFTPLSLINGMLDHLPEEVWGDPNLKWLDPANGIGNFPICVYYRLMEGLKEKNGKNVSLPTYANKKDRRPNGTVENTQKNRSRHIIENMLYMVELDATNVAISRSIFCEREGGVDINGNISQQDFLDQPLPRDFPEEYDVIMGNPPFQDSKSGSTAQGGHDLYPNFFIKSYNLLKPRGYITFINPPKWRAPNKIGKLNEMWEIFTSNNPIFLKIYGFSETTSLFSGGATTRIDYYILQKLEYGGNTVIIDEKNNHININITKCPFLPNYDYDIIGQIIDKLENDDIVIYSSSVYDKRKPYMNIEKTGKFKFPVRHSHTQKNGDIIYWSYTNEKGHFGEPKVILGKGLYIYPYNDFKGEYGMSNYSFGIPIKSKQEGDEIVSALNTNIFNNIIKATKWSSGFTDHNMFKYLKPNWYKIILKLERNPHIKLV